MYVQSLCGYLPDASHLAVLFQKRAPERSVSKSSDSYITTTQVQIILRYKKVYMVLNCH